MARRQAMLRITSSYAGTARAVPKQIRLDLPPEPAAADNRRMQGSGTEKRACRDALRPNSMACTVPTRLLNRRLMASNVKLRWQCTISSTRPHLLSISRINFLFQGLASSIPSDTTAANVTSSQPLSGPAAQVKGQGFGEWATRRTSRARRRSAERISFVKCWVIGSN